MRLDVTLRDEITFVSKDRRGRSRNRNYFSHSNSHLFSTECESQEVVWVKYKKITGGASLAVSGGSHLEEVGFLGVLLSECHLVPDREEHSRHFKLEI